MSLALINLTPGNADNLPTGGAEVNAAITLVNSHDTQIAVNNAAIAALQTAVAGLGGGTSSTITALAPAATFTGSEVLPLDQGATTVKATINNLGSRYGAMAQLSLSTQPGIDTTGVTDSLAGFNTAYALSLSTGKPLIVDCLCKLTIGTNDAKVIFLRNGTNIQGTPAGALIVDNSYIPAFVLHHTTDSVFKNLNIQYVGGAPWDNTIAPYSTLLGHFNDTVMKNDMSANFGNTFSGGGSSLFTGPTNPCAIFMCKGGVQRVTFDNVRMYAPQGANAANFIPVAFAFDAQWQPHTLVTNNSQPVLASNAITASDVDIINLRLDGYLMGIVGGGGIRITGMKCWRYSDLQKSDGTGLGGNGPWFAPPHAIYLTDVDQSFTGMTREIVNFFDYGQYVGGAVRRASTSGSILSVKISPTGNTVLDGVVSLRPDGFMDVLTNNYGNQFGSMRNLSFVYDSSINTIDANHPFGMRFPSAQPYNYLTVEGLVVRDLNPAPQQFPILDMGNINNQNCDFKGVKVYLNDWPGTGYPGFAMAGNSMTLEADYYFNTYSSDQTFRGSTCYQGTEVLTNSDLNVRVHGYRLFPVVFATPPTGTSTTLAANWGHSTGLYLLQFNDNQVRYATLTSGATTCTWAATGGGALTATATTGASGTGSVATVTFSTGSGVAVVGTQVTIAGVTPAGYNGTVTVTASSPGSVSYANATTGAQSVAGTILNFVNATAQNVLGANYSGYKQRMLSIQNGKAIGNRIRVMDDSNGLEMINENGVVSEYWSQNWAGTPPAGLTFDLPIAIPATHNPDRYSVNVMVALGVSAGLTSFSLGWAATSGALMTLIPPTVGSTPAPIAAPVTTNAGTIRTLRLTAVGGTGFDGTGSVMVSVRCSSQVASG